MSKVYSYMFDRKLLILYDEVYIELKMLKCLFISIADTGIVFERIIRIL
jgi:hypothetical protein